MQVLIENSCKAAAGRADGTGIAFGCDPTNSELTNLSVLSGESPALRRKKLGAEEAKLNRT